MKCLYHKNCFDGLGAALLVDLKFSGVELIAVQYGDEPPVVESHETVYIVDFSYDPQTLVDLANKAGEVIVLDHHHTAIEKCLAYFKTHDKPHNLTLVFDYDRSGAGLVWDVLFSTDEKKQWIEHTSCWKPCQVSDLRPIWIDHVQNRDLWRFNHPNPERFPDLGDTLAFMERLSFEGMDVKAWREALKADYMPFVNEGYILFNYKRNLAKKHIPEKPSLFEEGDYKGVWLNVPYYLASDVGNLLKDQFDFIAMYHDTGLERTVSLRSRPGVDVSKFAKRMGGGGHVNAAGFKTTVSWTPFDQTE